MRATLLWVPTRTPDAVIKRLQKAFTAINSDPSFTKTLAEAGVEPGLVMGRKWPPQSAASSS